MTAPLMAMVLLDEPIVFDPQSAQAVVDSFPKNAQAKLHAVNGDGTQLQILFDDVKFTVVIDAQPMALRDFSKTLGAPDGQSFEPMIAKHQAKLIVTCAHPGDEFGEVLMSAVATHLLAVKCGNLGAPLGGYWVSSERLCDWDEFSAYGRDVLPAFDNDPEVEFPSRYWVSVQLTQAGQLYGGHSQGLRVFTGYELDLTPVLWPMADVAQRLIGTVTYLFWHGPVLQDGETLGITETEQFRISHDPDNSRMKLQLETATHQNNTFMRPWHDR